MGRGVPAAGSMVSNCVPSHACTALNALDALLVQSELRDWLQHPPDGCRLVQYEDLHTWVIELQGPESPCQPQLYVGGFQELHVPFMTGWMPMPAEIALWEEWEGRR